MRRWAQQPQEPPTVASELAQQRLVPLQLEVSPSAQPQPEQRPTVAS